MQRAIIAAGCLLVIQLVLVVMLNLNSKSYESTPINSPFLGFDKEQLSSIKIVDGQGAELVLQKSGEKWIVPSIFSALAEQDQVTGLVEKLGDLKQGFVVAASASAANRFKVAEDLFERHLILYAGEEEAGNFYLGSSPGFRQMHARKSESDEIFTVSLSGFEVETSADNWLDKNVLKLKKDEIKQISFHDCILKKENGSWQLEGLLETEKVIEDEIKDAVEKVTGLTIKSVLDPKEVEDSFTSSTVDLKYSLKKADDREVTYSFVKLGEDRYGVKSSDNDFYYLVHDLLFDNLKKINRQVFLVDEASEAEESLQKIE